MKYLVQLVSVSLIGLLYLRQTTAADAQFTVIGCFADHSDARDLKGGFQDSSFMTPQFCANHCKDLGFNYAGTQYRRECYCGNSYGSYGSSVTCTEKCSGDAAQICGGDSANSVISLNKDLDACDKQKVECTKISQDLTNCKAELAKTTANHQLVNVALGRPATQSSPNNDYVAGTLRSLPGAVVDGKVNDTTWTQNSCTCTNANEKAWWAVDLGQPTAVVQVKVTSSANYPLTLPSDFRIGVTNTEPKGVLDPNSYDLCSSYTGKFPSNSNSTFICSAAMKPGRYVVVHNGVMGPMLLCEVEVFA